MNSVAQLALYIGNIFAREITQTQILLHKTELEEDFCVNKKSVNKIKY